MKKLIRALGLIPVLAVVMLLSTVIFVGFANNESVLVAADASDFTIRVLNGTYCTVTGYVGNDTAFVIPDEIYGYIVQAIDYGAFQNETALTQVILPNYLETLGSNAFSGCTGLTTINLSNTLTGIGTEAFSGCTGLISLTLPDSITTLGYYVFRNCSNLEEINYPRSLATVSSMPGYGEALLFAGCTKLTSSTVPEGVTTIPAYTFGGSPYLQTVVLPSSLTSIGNNAFHGCTGLLTMNLPSSLSNIGNDAFSGCTGLSAISFNGSLRTIGNAAFYGCTGLREITVNEGLETLSNAVFAGCTGLTTVNLPNTLTGIGTEAFSGCTGLISLTLPDSVTTLGYYVFRNCLNLEEINYPRSLANVSSMPGYGEARLFAGCTKLTSITVPEGVTTIPAYTFGGSPYLQIVVLPSSLISIGGYAFSGCSGLKEINLVEGLRIINQSTFANCSSLSVLSFPDSMESIGNSAYSGCIGLRLIIFNDGMKTIDSSAFNGCAGLTSIVLNDGLTTLSSYSFASCINVTSILIPKSVTSIAANCFNNCPKLKIYCYSASAAHYTAENNGYPYFLLDNHTHDYITAIETSPTCTRGGSAINTCTICGYNYIEVLEPLGHTAGDWIIVKEATCTEEGLKVNYCVIDGEQLDSETIPAAGHIFGEWSTEKEATVLANGARSRECAVCGVKETQSLPQIEIDISETNAYGLANFTVVNAHTLEPINGASIFVSTPNDGECTLIADENGKISQVLPVGNLAISAYAEGYLIRELKITVQSGIHNIPRIGLSERPMVEGKLSVKEMTYDEIIAAGIDPSAEGNQHIYQYQVEITFRAEIDVLSIMAFFNGSGKFLGGYGPNGGGGGGGDGKTIYYSGDYNPGSGGGYGLRLSDGTDVTVFPVSERFYLIIYGEVRWLKEMFDAELLVINNSLTDTIEDCEAELTLPDGLSFADMVYGKQSAVQTIDYVEEGGSESVHWYIRGDEEGTYNVTASLSGTMMPFDERFSYEYVAQDPIKVYAGSAMHMTFYIPDSAFEGEDYTITIELENVSHKSIYGLSHMIHGIQGQVTHYSDGTVVEKTQLIPGAGAGTRELKPGDKLVIETTVNIFFHSEMIQYELDRMISLVDGIEAKLKAIDNIKKCMKMFEAAGKAADTLTASVGKLSDIIDAGGFSLDTVEEIWELRSLGNFMKFGRGEAAEPEFNVYNSIRFMIDNIPVRFVVERVVVTTLSGSTTEIPYTIQMVPVGARHFGVDNVGKYMYDTLLLAIGPQDGKLFGFSYKDKAYQQAMQRVIARENEISNLKVSAPSHTTTRIWIEPIAKGNSITPSSIAFSDSNFIIATDNLTASFVDGSMIFTGSGKVEITPLSKVGGILYFENSEGDVQTFQIDVVESHDCHSDSWIVLVPPTENTIGYKVLLCDVCGDFLGLQEMIPCGNHIFNDWEMRIQPTNTTYGIQTRTCDICGVFEYEIIDPIIITIDAEISIDMNSWGAFWNAVPFQLFSKGTKTVAITANSNTDDEISIQYHFSPSELTLDQLNELEAGWQEYSNPFDISPNSKLIIYVKLTDIFGNSTYINSAGMVLYTDSEAVTTDISFTKGSGLDQAAGVSLNGNTVQKIMNGETTLEAGVDYSVLNETITFNGRYLDSLEAGSYALSVFYNPLGEAYANADGNEAPETTEIFLTVVSKPVVLEEITITTLPEKTVYTVGESLDLTGMIVTAKYNDGSEKEVADYTVDPAGKAILTTVGTQTIFVSHTEGEITKTANFAITVNAIPDVAPPTGEIRIDAKAWNSFWNTVTFGLMYKNTKTVTITARDDSGDDVTIEYYISNTAMTLEELEGLGAEWQDYTSAFDLIPRMQAVVYAKLTGRSGNTTYINSDGVVLYADSEAMTLGFSIIEGTAEDQEAFVTLNGNTIQKIMNNEEALVCGKDYTVSGKAITFTADYLNSLKVGEYTLTIYYNPLGMDYVDAEGNEAPGTTTIVIVVNSVPIALDKIVISTLPNKTDYSEGEELDLTGLIVSAAYSDGSNRFVMNYATTPANNTTLHNVGEQTVVVSYAEDDITETASFTIMVKAIPIEVILDSITIAQYPDRTEYTEGEALDLTGMIVMAKYNDESTKDVTAFVSANPANDAILNAIGIQTVDVTYIEEGIVKTTSFSVFVDTALVMPMLDSITVTSYPSKTNYKEGETLDLTGMIVIATYSDTSTQAVTGYSTDPAEGAVLNNSGLQLITVIYTEDDLTRTTTFAVNVAPLSDDATLASLVVGEGMLTPVFDPNTMAYTVTVGYSITSINIMASANHERATVTGAGAHTLNVGENRFELTVIAENGLRQDYNVVVTREEALPLDNNIMVGDVEIPYTIENDVVILEPNKEQIDTILGSEDVIVFDFSDFTTQGAININFDAEWFKDVDKTITIITAEGSITIKTKMLWNNSGKTRVITVQDNKVDIKNK